MEEETSYENAVAIAEGQLIPPAVPTLHPVDLRTLASQLPDLSNLG